MTRKRLGAIDRASVTELRGEAEKAARDKRGVVTGKAPPIAQVAGSAARSIEDEIFRLRQENEELQGAAKQWTAARQGGLVVQLVPLDQIDIHALSRDRRTLNRDGESWAELKASLRARGQQVPIEIGGRSSVNGRFRLVSGYRRVSALRELFEETGEDRFATAKALVSRTRDRAEAMVAMIDENEIRQGISFYERGRICCMATEQGVFDTIDDAIQTLFASSSRNRRYKIRNFTIIHARLGSYLDFPEQIGERLGARLAQALKDGRESELTRVLSDREKKFTDPAEELALLEAFIARKGLFAVAKQPPAEEALTAQWHGKGNLRASASAKGSRVTVKLEGLTVGDRADLEALVARLGVVAASTE